MDSFRLCASCARLGRDSADGGRAKEIVDCDEVIGMPLLSLVRRVKYLEVRKRLTISSGSSGNSVMVPEPSRSMFCFFRSILKLLECVWYMDRVFILVGMKVELLASYFTELSSACKYFVCWRFSFDTGNVSVDGAFVRGTDMIL